MGNTRSRGLSFGWDVGELTTENSEKRLLYDGADTGDFLVRWDRGLGSHVLSVRAAPIHVKHFPIIKDVSEGVGAALYSIDDEYGVYTEAESPIKGFQYATIEEMLENFVKGGPYAKIAFKHFGCFLLRVSKSPPVRQTAPPTAFADAPQSSMWGGGRGTSFLNGKGHTSDTGFGRRPSLPSHGASQTAGARGLSADPRNGSMMSRGRRSSTTNLGAGGGAGGSGLGGGSGRGKLNTAGSFVGSRSPSMLRSRSHPNVRTDRASSKRGPTSSVSRKRQGSITTPPNNAPEAATHVNGATHTYTTDGDPGANTTPGNGIYDDMQFAARGNAALGNATYDEMQFGSTYDDMQFGKVDEEEGVEMYDAPAFAQPRDKRRSVMSVTSVGEWGGEATEDDDSDEETFGFN